MDKTRARLLEIVKKSMDASTDYNAVYIKYTKKRYGAVSTIITTMVSLILESSS